MARKDSDPHRHRTSHLNTTKDDVIRRSVLVVRGNLCALKKSWGRSPWINHRYL